MTRMLLLGAGFSRNWGGWLASEVFEYLLGCPEISGSQRLMDLLWECQKSGSGFEGALADLQNMVTREPEGLEELRALDRAVSSMFVQMNRGFSRMNIDHNGSGSRSIRTFLTLFDAIFTLNQDSLMEHQYLGPVNSSPQNVRQGKWKGIELPGMRTPAQNEYLTPDPGLPWIGWWEPAPPEQYEVNPYYQPYFKLHGSANWRSDDGRSMLIMGGNKAHEIGLSPVLQWYQEQFREHLSRGDSRLMVIGYGFRDKHINEVIKQAVRNHGLKLFVISPDGASQAEKVREFDNELEDAFRQGLIGASRRPLRDTFSEAGSIEFAKLFRFLS